MTKEYLKETAKEYIEKYPERLELFLNEFEADESDFLEREIDYFNNTLYDLENSEGSHDGYSITGIDNFLIAYDLCNEIGWDKFMYSTKKKIKFLESKTSPPPQPIVKPKPEQETPKTFEELVYNTDLVTPCIDILKELEPPLIDTDCNYIGKLKGVFCVWIDEMQRQGIVKYYSDRKIFASLIPQKIKRFSIDESMFGKHQRKAEQQYRTDIKTMVSKIKLSKNSQ